MGLGGPASLICDLRWAGGRERMGAWLLQAPGVPGRCVLASGPQTLSAPSTFLLGLLHFQIELSFWILFISYFCFSLCVNQITA